MIILVLALYGHPKVESCGRTIVPGEWKDAAGKKLVEEDSVSELVRRVAELQVTILNSCIYVSVWSPWGFGVEPGPPEWHSKADGNAIMTTPVFMNGVACGTAPVKAEPCNTDREKTEGRTFAADPGPDKMSSENILCDSCWEALPST